METELEIGTIALQSGGRIGICALPGLNRDLQADLDTIFDWNPALVLSMTERHEMDACDSYGLGTALQDKGVDWIHLSVVDFGGLEGDNLKRWPSVSESIHRVLANGKGVMVHCRGGQGRSGMIALRILIEDGEAPDDALRRLRQVRPGAVETSQQMNWATHVGE